MALPPAQMPLPPAEIVPELLMPPEKVEIVTDTVSWLARGCTPALPPAQMPLPPAEIVPELLMPPDEGRDDHRYGVPAGRSY